MELGMPLPPGMTAVCRNKLSTSVYRDLVLLLILSIDLINCLFIKAHYSKKI